MAQPDIELLFGVLGGGDIAGTSGKNIKDAIDNIVKEINNKPPEIQLKLDEASIKDFKQELENLTTFAQTEAGKIKAAYNIKFTTGPTGGGGTKKKVTPHTLLGTSGNDYLKALTDIQKTRIEVEKLLAKWNDSASGDISYKRIQDVNSNLKAFESSLRNGSMFADDLERNMAEAKTVISQAAAELDLLHTKSNKVDFGIGTDAHTKALTQVNKLLEQTTKNYNSWTAAARGSTATDYESLKAYCDELKGLSEALINGTISFENYQKSFSKIKAGIEQSTNAIKAAGKNTKTWADHVGALVKKFSSWLSVSKLVMGAVKTLRKMIDNVVKLDTAMTELRKVTNETESAYVKFLENAESRAKKLGATLTDVVSATADFARLGFSMDDASTLANAAIVYKNVGDGIESIGQASESIISTMQAFGLTANEVMSIVDKFNEVGNNFAISATGIGDALLNSASALHAAGNSLDESIAMIAATNEIIQSPEKVGTALKTLSMYIRAAKTEAEEAGIETEGMANSVSELREQIMQLTKNRVDIMESDHDFKSTYQIVKELSEVWGTLKGTERSALTELIGGGVRNANVVNALMTNFAQAEKALATSLASSGSAMKENEKVLDSIEGRISKFQAAFQGLSSTVINTNIVKGVVSMGTTIINILDAIIDGIGGLGLALGAVPLVMFVSKLKPVSEGLSIIKDAFKSTVGGAKGRSLKYAHYTVMVTWNESEYPARRCIANGLKSQDFCKWCA